MSDASFLFDDRQSYSALMIAQRLGRTGNAESQVRWVREKVFQDGCNFKRAGNQFLATGAALNRWIDQGSGGWDEKL